jgi:hypothetical protein
MGEIGALRDLRLAQALEFASSLEPVTDSAAFEPLGRRHVSKGRPGWKPQPAHRKVRRPCLGTWIRDDNTEVLTDLETAKIIDGEVRPRLPASPGPC